MHQYALEEVNGQMPKQVLEYLLTLGVILVLGDVSEYGRLLRFLKADILKIV
jgi:hypothetical protein